MNNDGPGEGLIHIEVYDYSLINLLGLWFFFNINNNILPTTLRSVGNTYKIKTQRTLIKSTNSTVSFKKFYIEMFLSFYGKHENAP